MVKIEQRELIGKRFNGLTIVSYSHTDDENKDVYLCKCHCGNEKLLRGVGVKNGRTTTCGCNQDFLRKGQKYHHLTLVERNETLRGDRWFVKCDCGSFFNASGLQIRRAYIKSCGCKRSKVANTSTNEYSLIDLTNMYKVIRNKSTALILKACRMKAGKDITDIPSNIASVSRYFDLETNAELSDREFRMLTAYFDVSIGEFTNNVLKIEKYLIERVQSIGMESEMTLTDLIDTLIANMLSGKDNV